MSQKVKSCVRGDLRAGMKIHDAEESAISDICGKFRGSRLKSDDRQRTNHFNERFIQIHRVFSRSEIPIGSHLVVQVCPISSEMSFEIQGVPISRFRYL